MFVNELHQGGIRAIVDYDPTVFNNMVVPSGLSLQEIVDHILFKYGDAPLFCPEPSVMKYYIRLWSRRRIDIWERFIEAASAQYDPISNYDRTEETSDLFTHGHKVKTDDDLNHGHKIVTNDDLSHGLTVENQISADNASTYQADRKSINSGKDERDADETHSGKDERDVNEIHSGTDKRIYKSHISGNIGVTTSQQMLQQELDIIVKFDVIDFIADDWHSEFNLMIY